MGMNRFDAKIRKRFKRKRLASDDISNIQHVIYIEKFCCEGVY